MNHRHLLQRTHRYISHSQHVWTNANKVHTSGVRYGQVRERITFCKNAIAGVNMFAGAPAICRMILSMRKPLRDILPHENNNSYLSALEEYESIMQECERILSELKSNQNIHTTIRSAVKPACFH